MQTKTITLNKLGIDEMLLSCDKGTYQRGRNMFFLYRDYENNCLAGQWIWGVREANDVLKTISIKWFDFKIFLKAGKTLADPLESLPNYFDPDGHCLHTLEQSEVPVKDTTSEGSFIHPVYGQIYYYDLFYDMGASDNAGPILFGTSVKKRLEGYKNVTVIRFTDEGQLEFFQPILFNVDYSERTSEEDPYQITVTVTDSEGACQFSSDGEIYQPENIVTYASSENNKVYIKDVAGTVAEFDLEPANWVDNILS